MVCQGRREGWAGFRQSRAGLGCGCRLRSVGWAGVWVDCGLGCGLGWGWLSLGCGVRAVPGLGRRLGAQPAVGWAAGCGLRSLGWATLWVESRGLVL